MIDVLFIYRILEVRPQPLAGESSSLAEESSSLVEPS